MPSAEYCQGVYDQLVWNGFPNAAKQMAGEAHNNADFLGEFPNIPDGIKEDMQSCAGMTATKMIEEAVAGMTPEERKAEKKRTKAKAEKAKAGSRGKLAIQDPGTISSAEAYGEIMAAIDAEDAKAGPLGFLTGAGPFGIPRWVLWAGGAFIAYQAITGGARAYGRARGSK